MDFVLQGKSDRGDDSVRSLAVVLDDDITNIIDQICIVSLAADHSVGAQAAVQRVRAIVAGQDIGRLIADDEVIA